MQLLKERSNFHLTQGQQHSYKRALCFILCLRSITKGFCSAVWQPVCLSPLWLMGLAPVLACAELTKLSLDLWQKLSQDVPKYLLEEYISHGSSALCRAPICQCEAWLVDLATHGGQTDPIRSWLCGRWGAMVSFQDRCSTLYVWMYYLMPHQKFWTVFWSMALWCLKAWFYVGSSLGTFVGLDHNLLPIYDSHTA